MCSKVIRFIRLFSILKKLDSVATLSVWSESDGYTEVVMYIPGEDDKLTFTCFDGIDGNGRTMSHRHWSHRT